MGEIRRGGGGGLKKIHIRSFVCVKECGGWINRDNMYNIMGGGIEVL